MTLQNLIFIRFESSYFLDVECREEDVREALEDLEDFRIFSLRIFASNLWYSCRLALDFSARFLFKALSFRFRCSLSGVINRWILGATVLGVPSFFGGRLGLVRRITYWRTSSSLLKLNIFLILLATLGPKVLGLIESVSPGISPSPAFIILIQSTLRKCTSMIHPRIDLLLRSPFRFQAWKPWAPAGSSSLTRLVVSTPCFMGKPSLSLPAVILPMKPFHSFPKKSISIRAPNRWSFKLLSFFSSLNSICIWLPVAGYAMLNFIFHNKLLKNNK